MNTIVANHDVEEKSMPAKIDEKTATDLFLKLSPEAQDEIIDLIKFLLSKQ